MHFFFSKYKIIKNLSILIEKLQKSMSFNVFKKTMIQMVNHIRH